MVRSLLLLASVLGMLVVVTRGIAWWVVPLPLRGLATLVVVEGPSNCQDSHRTGKPGAKGHCCGGPGVPLGVGGDPRPVHLETPHRLRRTTVYLLRLPRRLTVNVGRACRAPEKRALSDVRFCWTLLNVSCCARQTAVVSTTLTLCSTMSMCCSA